jgi:LmbE family N-acetylglucosaminyl deacetylase
MRHIYLSPHLDDAVLSCGGTMHGQIAAGEEVVVVNVFAGSPDYPEYSTYARRQHRKWGSRDGSMATRLAEDQAVLDQMGVTVENWGYLECIYRKGRDGRWLYDSHDAIFGDVAEDDAPWIDDFRLSIDDLDRVGAVREPPVPNSNEWRGLNHQSSIINHQSSIRAVAGDAPNVTIYAPLAVGHHVDHQLVRAVAIEMAQTNPAVCFYEDFPYVARDPDALKKALAEVESEHWTAFLVSIDVEAKIAAIAGYRSQIQALFGELGHMERVVREYAQSLGDSESYFERYWALRQPYFSHQRRTRRRVGGSG